MKYKAQYMEKENSPWVDTNLGSFHTEIAAVEAAQNWREGYLRVRPDCAYIRVVLCDEPSHDPLPELLEALKNLVSWMDDSGLSFTTPAGVGAFRTDPVEYSVVTDARAAIAKAEGRDA